MKNKFDYDKYMNTCDFCYQEVGEENLTCVATGGMAGYANCCESCIELNEGNNCWRINKDNIYVQGMKQIDDVLMSQLKEQLNGKQ